MPKKSQTRADLLQRVMAGEIVRQLYDPTGAMRVLIVRRADGRFTYRRRERVAGGWGPATIDAGVYDSAGTAELEARQRVTWLKDRLH